MQIFHLIDFGEANPWIEKVILEGKRQGYSTGLISINDLESWRSNPLFDQTTQFYDLKQFRELFQLIARYRNSSDIALFSHGHKASIIATLLKQIMRCKLVIVHHHAPNGLHHLANPSVNSFRTKVHRLLSKTYYKNSNLIVCLSSVSSRYLMNLGIAENKIATLPLGVDFRGWDEEAPDVHRCNSKTSENGMPLRFILVGRLQWEKNYDLAIKTMLELKRKGFQSHFTIFGIGPELERIERQIRLLNLENEIKLAGFSKDLLFEYQNYNALLHFSHTESYGQCLIEARLSGIPVITTNVGIAMDLVNAGDSNVKIVKEANPEEFANVIITHFSNSIDSNKFYSRQDMQQLHQKHGLERCLENLYGLLKR